MAKFTPGPAIAAASGSVGGTVFSRNRGGAYMRNRSVPLTVTSPAALAAKARLAAYSAAWQGLTAGQRLAWQAFADQRPIINTLGFPRILTGQQAYVGINSRLDLAGQTTISTPPISTGPNALTALTLAADIGAGNVDLTFAPTPLGATEHLWIQGAIVNSQGINFVKNLLRFVSVSPAAQASAYDIESAVTARLGGLSVGQELHVQVAVFDNATGLLSLPLRSRATVVTT